MCRTRSHFVCYILLLCSCTGFTLAEDPASAKFIYVDGNASGTNDGTSWEDAYNILQDALNDASASTTPVSIRIAQGLYTPDKSSVSPQGTKNRQATFLIAGYDLKGGYAGVKDADPDLRDPLLYKTILSGDLAGDDPLVESSAGLSNVSTKIDNSMIVVTTSNETFIDGVVITGGYNPEGNGSGLYPSSGDLHLTNSLIVGNISKNGSGCYSAEGDLSIQGSDFKFNVASGQGGAIRHYTHILEIRDSTFDDNVAYEGGAIVTGGSARIENTLFVNNHSNDDGGAIIAVTEMSDDSQKHYFTGCSFINNYAVTYGGAVTSLARITIEKCRFEKCRLTGNNSEGGALSFWSGSIVTIKDSIFTNCSTLYSGGAIFALRAFMTIQNSSFISNHANGIGGALSLHRGSTNQSWTDTVSISDCVFEDNTSNAAGAISGRYNARIYVDKSLFRRNSSVDNGGAIVASDGKIFSVSNSSFSNNVTLQRGGAINAQNNPMKIYNSTFSDNIAESGAVVSVGGERILTMRNSICFTSDPSNRKTIPYIWVESGSVGDVQHTCLAYDSFGGSGNIYIDPLLADPDNGDYHLKSQGGRYDPDTHAWIYDDATSPCIDAGDPMFPIAHEPFPNGGVINMGAYGGTTEASKSYFGKPLCETIVAGDINGDCNVNLLDFALMALHWCDNYNP